ncbi:MAG: polyphenol oxidase family protein [Candidatus Moraniibacteriota bacterium]
MNIFHHPEVVTFLSEKADGDMKLSGKESLANRKVYLEKNKLNGFEINSARLKHGKEVEIIKKVESKIIEEADGLLSGERGLILTVTVADCLPIYLFDPETRVYGVLHAGWRSLEKGIIKEAAEKMRHSFNIDSKRILAGIGAGIGACHFEVKEDFKERFSDFPQFFIYQKEKTFFNLKGLAKFLLLQEGVFEENISVKADCAYCLENKYFSFRRDGKKNGGVQAMLAGIVVI